MKKNLQAILSVSFALFLATINTQNVSMAASVNQDAIIIDDTKHAEYRITKKEAKQLEKSMKENQLAKIKEEKAEYKKIKEEIKRLKKENKGKIEAPETAIDEKKVKEAKMKQAKNESEEEIKPISDKKTKKQKEQISKEEEIAPVSDKKEKVKKEKKNDQIKAEDENTANKKEEKLKKEKQAKNESEEEIKPVSDKKPKKQKEEISKDEEIAPVSDKKEEQKEQVKNVKETKNAIKKETVEEILDEEIAPVEEVKKQTKDEIEEPKEEAGQEKEITEKEPEIYKKNHTYEDIDKEAVSINEFLQFSQKQNEKFSIFYYKTTSKLNALTKQIKDKENYIKEVKKNDIGYKAQYDKLKKADRELEALMRERDDFYNKSLEKFDSILTKKQSIKWELLQQMGYRFLPEFD